MPKKKINPQNWMEFQPQLEALFNEVKDAIFFIDQNSNIVFVNQSASELTGYERSELIGKTFGTFFLDHPHIDNFDEYLSPPDHIRSHLLSPKNHPKNNALILSKDGFPVSIEVTHIHLHELQNKFSCIIARDNAEQTIAETLREVTSTLTSSLNLNEIFDRLLVELQKIIPYDGGNVMLVTGKSVHITRTFGYDTFGEKLSEVVDSLRFDIESTENIKQIISDKQAFIAKDTQQISYWDRNEASRKFRSWIGVPVIIDNKVDAILSLDKVEPNFFNKKHVSILRIFSNQAASAIKNARLYEEESRRIQQLDGLQSTLAAINSQLELKTLLKEIVTRAIKLLHASMGELALYEPDLNKLRVLVSQNFKQDIIGQLLEVVKGESVLGTVAATRKPYKTDRFTQGENHSMESRALESHAILAVPLLAGKDLLGVLEIVDVKKDRVFEDTDVNLLNTFAQQATIAINNSRLYEDAKRRAEEAETIRKAGAVVTSSLKQSEAINLILEQLALVVPYDMAAVLLAKKETLTFVGGRGFDSLDSILGRKILLSDESPSVSVYKQKVALNFGNIPIEFPSLNREPGASEVIKSWLGAPLVIQDRTLGVIFLISFQPDQFNQDHVRLIVAFADQVAIALENSRLYTNTARLAERFETLYHLSQIISFNIRSEDIFPAIYQAVSELMTTEFFAISLYNAETRMIEDVYMVDDGILQPFSSRPLGKGLTSNILKNGKSLLFHTFDEARAEEMGVVMVGNMDNEQISQSILMVPLKIGTNCIGVLSAQSYTPNMYSNSDRETLELLAANVAIAIENARLFDEVQQLAITDPLTNIFNRRKFEELAIKEFERARRYHHPMCLIMADLDHFKQVNDTFGHIVGDQVLSGLASLCRSSLRNNDVLARYGGEEFVILLPETASAEAMITAERLRQDCENAEFNTNQGSISITISLGVVEMDHDCKTLEELVDRADQALYASKNTGRNKSTLWTPDLAQITPVGRHTPEKE